MSTGRELKSGPGSYRRRITFFAVSGAVAVAIVIALGGVLLPFLLAIVLAYVLSPVVDRMQRRMPRWVAVLIIVGTMLGGVAAFVAIGVPRIVVELQRLVADVPTQLARVRAEWLPLVEETLREATEEYGSASGGGDFATLEDDQMAAGVDGGVPTEEDAIVITPRESGGYAVRLPPGGIEVRHGEDGAYVIAPREEGVGARRDVFSMTRQALERQISNVEGYAVTLVKTLNTVVRVVVRSIFGFFLMLMITAYLLITKDSIFRFFRSLVLPERRDDFDSLIARMDRGLSGVVRGQLLIALVNGALSGIGFYLLDLEYWPILTLIATVLSIIPIFGAILSSVPAVIIALANGYMTALLTLGFIIGIHQLEANVLNPKIMGDAAKVHPVLVIFALLGGEHLFGLAGVLFAVPVLSILQSLFLHFKDIALGEEGAEPKPAGAPAPDA